MSHNQLYYFQVDKGVFMDKTIVELFAGVGGFRLGLERNPGFKTVWASQWEPSTKKQHAYEIYIQRFGSTNVSNEDINTVDKNLIPNHTLLVGGFPCQDYSVARTKAAGIQGKKGVLWWSIHEVLKSKNPPFFLLENVDRLIKSPGSQRGRDFGVMMRTISDLGYSLEWRVINAAEYGFAQRRRRVFMFGAHQSTQYHQSLKKQEPLELLKRDGFFSSQFPVQDIQQLKSTDVTKNLYQDLVKVSDLFSFNFLNSGLMIDGKVITAKVNPKIVPYQPLSGLIEKKVDKQYYINQKDKIEKFNYLKGPKKINRTDKSGYEYVYSEGGMAFPDPLDKPARTMLTSEGSINRSTHVISDPNNGKLRLLTPKECERINGFNDDWTKQDINGDIVSDRKRYFLMGNALVVGLIEKMGQSLSRIMDSE